MDAHGTTSPARHHLPSAVGVLRWFARLVGVLLLLLLAAFAVGEGLPNPLAMLTAEQWLSVALLVMVAGLIVAWKWHASAGC